MIKHVLFTLALGAALGGSSPLLLSQAAAPSSGNVTPAAGTTQPNPGPKAGTKPGTKPDPGVNLLPPTPSRPQYAGEPVVIEQLSTIYKYSAEGTGEKTIHARIRIQSEAAARAYGVLNVPYAAGNEQVDMRMLRVHKADGTVVDTPAADAQDMPAEVTRLAPFYSDLRQKQYPVRSLAVGDTFEYEGVVHLTKAQAEIALATQASPAQPSATQEGEFWGAESFSTNVVALEEKVELRLPTGRTVTVVSPRNKAVVSEEGSERVYRWHSSQLKPSVPLVVAAGAKDTPAADAEPPSGLPDIAWTSFANWAQVGTWYRSLATDRARSTPELQARAAALTAGATSDEEKVRRIYAYVSGNIRYIGVAFGIGRYQPHAAAEVLANQYGDCKDKHTLLSALLAAAGFEASPALIGEGVKFDADVPAPSSFNHVITVVALPASGATPARRVWLDSTAEVAPYGMLSAPLRNADALLIFPDRPPGLEKTPATLPFTAFDHWEANATLDKEGKLSGHFDVTMRGDIELMLRWSLHQATAAQWPQLGQQLSSNFGFSGTVTNFAPSSAEQTETPLHYAYDYERAPFGDWPNHRILALSPYGLFATAPLDKKPSEPIPTGNPRLESARSVIHLPEGYTAVLPDPVHIRSSFANYDVTYSTKDRDLICETRLDVRATAVPVAAWEEYNAFARGVQEHSEVFVQLHAPGDAVPGAVAASDATSTASGPAGTGAVNDVGAEALLREAWQSFQAKDYPGAQAKIDAARALNPEQPGLWALTGAIAASTNHLDDAEADDRKEVELHPDNSFALQSLASLQMYRKERPQAIETFQKVLKLKPGDPTPTLTLASLLTLEKRYPEALTLLQTAAFKNPGNKELILQLARTQLAAGRTEEAISTLHSALDETSDPLVLNDAAYELASHQADLPLAETSARKALTALETESQKYSLTDVSSTQLGRAQLLSATWDTLGWIEYERGDLPQAESLLAAAWATSQHAEVAYHLGQVYERQGHPQAAYDAYQRGKAAMHKGETFTGSDDFELRLAALTKQGMRATPNLDANHGIGEERVYTLPLISSGKKQLGGDYYLLLSPGKLEAVSFIEGAPELKALETRLADALQPALAASGRPPLLPPGSGAKIIRRGVLSCSPLLHSCMLVLMLPQDVPRPAPAAQTAKAAADN